MDDFAKTQLYPPNELCVIVPKDANYEFISIFGIKTDMPNFARAISLNYRYGQPLFACSFSGIITLTDCTNALGETVSEDVFYITLETPLKRERQIYAIEIDNEGKKSFVLDVYRSRHLVLPPEINRFNQIIQPNEITSN